MKDQNQYILGTEWAELHRLGIQHQVWASEARKGWELAEFGAGQTLLDLGSGPGFCSRDLAYLTGEAGKVIAVDKSKHYLDFLDKIAELHRLKIETIWTDFEAMDLGDVQLDGVYSRWALAWIRNVDEVVEKVVDNMVSGGAFVAHEYYHWGTFMMEPHYPELQKGIDTILKNFKEQEGDIDIGRKLPTIFYENGLEVISIRPMAKIVTPDQMAWQWLKTFLEIFLPKLEKLGALTKAEIQVALDQLYELDQQEDATIQCPQMVEVIGIKP